MRTTSSGSLTVSSCQTPSNEHSRKTILSKRSYVTIVATQAVVEGLTPHYDDSVKRYFSSLPMKRWKRVIGR